MTPSTVPDLLIASVALLDNATNDSLEEPPKIHRQRYFAFRLTSIMRDLANELFSCMAHYHYNTRA